MNTKTLIITALLCLIGGVNAWADEATLQANSANITNGNTATWTQNDITWTLSGGSITWDGTNNCYTLAASTTYTLTWNKTIIASKMVANQQSYRDNEKSLFGKGKSGITLTSGSKTTGQVENFSQAGDAILDNISEFSSIKIITGEAKNSNTNFTFRLFKITVIYDIPSSSHGVNVTNEFIVNPTFDSDVNGWSAINGTDAFYHKGSDAKFNGGLAECWTDNDAGRNGSIQQTLNNLPAGFYTLSAKCVSGWNTGKGNDYLYVKVGNSPMLIKEQAGADGDPTNILAISFYTNGTDVVVGYRKNNTQWWSAIDDVTLTYFGNDIANNNDFSFTLSNNTADWAGSTGTPNGVPYPERYKDNGGFDGDAEMNVGRIMYQTINGLPNGFYEVQFYAVENHANNVSSNFGNNIARVYAKSGDTQVYKDIEVYDLSSCNVLDYPHTLICKVVDGTLEYGLRNIASGGNWAVVATKSLTYLGTSVSESRTTAAAKYGTICLPYKFTTNGTAKVYTTTIDGSKVILTETNEIEAGMPYIYKATSDNPSFTYDCGNLVGQPVDGAPLVGVFESKLVPVGDYVMQTQKGIQNFFIVADGQQPTITKYRAYIHTANNARMLTFGVNDETAIEAIEALVENKAEIYDLNGRRLSGLQKGINIVNGKKILVK